MKPNITQAVQAFTVSGAQPFGGFATPDFTAEALEGARSLVSALGDAVEAGVGDQPMRAALTGIEFLVSLAILSNHCEEMGR